MQSCQCIHFISLFLFKLWHCMFCILTYMSVGNNKIRSHFFCDEIYCAVLKSRIFNVLFSGLFGQDSSQANSNSLPPSFCFYDCCHCLIHQKNVFIIATSSSKFLKTWSNTLWDQKSNNSKVGICINNQWSYFVAF